MLFVFEAWLPVSISMRRGFIASGNLPHELDFEQAVVERSTLDLDVVFEIELALEGSRRDALIQELMIWSGLGLPIGLVAANSQLVLLSRDRDLVRREAGDSQRNPIAILPGELSRLMLN